MIGLYYAADVNIRRIWAYYLVLSNKSVFIIEDSIKEELVNDKVYVDFIITEKSKLITD